MAEFSESRPDVVTRSKRSLVVVVCGILVFAGTGFGIYRYTHPARNIFSVMQNRWDRYSPEYVNGYIVGYKTGGKVLEEIIGLEHLSLGIAQLTRLAKYNEQKAISEMENSAKTIDELRGMRDGYRDTTKDLFIKIDDSK